MREYIAYIDEAGDEGFGKIKTAETGGQSRWFILAAVVTSQEKDALLPGWKRELLTHFPQRKSRDIHFRNLKHDQKVFVCQKAGALPVRACVTFSNKTTISGTKWAPVFRKKGYLYNYLLRWLLERLTTACAVSGEGPCTLKVVFSRRSGTDYAAMKNYLVLMRDGREMVKPIRLIRWDVLDVENIAVENHSKWTGLQVADVVGSAFLEAVEPNHFGNYETRYAEALSPSCSAELGAR